MSNKEFIKLTKNYLENINDLFDDEIIAKIKLLADDLQKCWVDGSMVYICEWW